MLIQSDLRMLPLTDLIINLNYPVITVRRYFIIMCHFMEFFTGTGGGRNRSRKINQALPLVKFGSKRNFALLQRFCTLRFFRFIEFLPFRSFPSSIQAFALKGTFLFTLLFYHDFAHFSGSYPFTGLFFCNILSYNWAFTILQGFALLLLVDYNQDFLFNSIVLTALIL